MNKEELFIFPDHGNIFYDLIKNAKQKIILSSQVLPNKEFCSMLFNLASQGIDIKILLTDARYFNLFSQEKISEFHNVHSDIVYYSQKKLPCEEKNLFLLNQAGLYPHFINHNNFFLNHSKYLIIDGEKMFIGSSVYSRTSKIDFGLLLCNSDLVKLLEQVFYIDYYNEYKDIIFDVNEDLVVAPHNMRKSVINFIMSAKRSVLIMAPAITDDLEIFNVLCKKIQEGIDFKILCSPHIFAIGGNTHKSIIDHYYNLKLQNLGGIIKMVYNPLIHGKVIVIDHECKSSQKVYISSANLRTSALDRSREVGVYSRKTAILSEIISFFEKLWKNSVDYS